jgi:sulfatase modifying factor 1
VDSFEQNKYGMKNIVGNVWEWVADWWTINHNLNNFKNPVSDSTTNI